MSPAVSPMVCTWQNKAGTGYIRACLAIPARGFGIAANRNGDAHYWPMGTTRLLHHFYIAVRQEAYS